MKYFLFVIIFGSMALFSMERNETALTIQTEGRSPFDDNVSSSTNSSVNNSSVDEEDELCDIAVSRFSALGQFIKPYLKNMLKEPSDSPLRREHSNAEILKRIKSGEDQDHRTQEAVHAMVVKATAVAFEKKEQELAAREKRIKEKYSGKKTAAIAAITATISTVVTTICSTLITIYSSKK